MLNTTSAQSIQDKAIRLYAEGELTEAIWIYQEITQRERQYFPGFANLNMIYFMHKNNYVLIRIGFKYSAMELFLSSFGTFIIET